MIQPYLMFEGRAEEAAEFYQRVLGAKIEMLMRFKESPERNEQCAPPGADDKVMHMSLRIGDSVIMGSDGMCSGKPAFQGISLSIEARDVTDAERLFAALGDGGEVQMPMMKTFFSPAFGMVADRFGVSWMVVTTPPAV